MTIVGVVGTVKQCDLDVDGRIVVYRRRSVCWVIRWRGRQPICRRREHGPR